MKTPAPALAILILAFCSTPLFIGGQGIGLFRQDPAAAVIRKAKRYNLVAVKDAVPGVIIDMRYKITSASGKPLYRNEMPCLVHRSSGQKLHRVNKALKEHGYALKIWDAWRPPEAHIALWNAVKDPRYVVSPSKGFSWHCYGISIDLTLVKTDGTPVAMPSKFDEFSDKAKSNYTGSDTEIQKRVELLQTLMKEAGFRTIESEWWHFDDMKAQGGIRRVNAADLGIRMPQP